MCQRFRRARAAYQVMVPIGFLENRLSRKPFFSKNQNASKTVLPAEPFVSKTAFLENRFSRKTKLKLPTDNVTFKVLPLSITIKYYI